jgi:predicted cytidylate kinase
VSEVKKQIITIAGRPGSGKSSTAKAVASRLGFNHFSSGDLMRSIGVEMGIDILQTNLTAEKDGELDRRVDERQAEMGRTETRLVIDARLAWHFIPESFKVFLDLDLTTAAQRVLGGIDEARMKSEHIPSDLQEYAKVLEQRLSIEARRYKAKYGADPYDKSNYDLVIDTGANDLEQVVKLVVEGYQDWLKAA